jgi:Arc/MetJ-type ribon-helix-helix transcriptional regulator
MLTVAMDERFVDAIDRLIDSSGMYSSRSEFMKDAIRKNFEVMLKSDESLRKIHEGMKKLAELSKKRGNTGRMPTKKERDKFAIEFMKEKGLL